MTVRRGIDDPHQTKINIATTYVSRFSSIIALLLLFPIVANSVGHDAYGLYLLVASMGILLQSDVGMASATIRFVSSAYTTGDQSRLTKTVSSSHWFFNCLAILSTTVFVLLFVVGWSEFGIPEELKSEAKWLVVLSGTQIFVGFSTSVHRQVLTGIGRLDLANWTQLGQMGARIVSTITVIALGGNIVAVGVVDTLCVLLAAATFWILRRRTKPSTNSSLRNGSVASIREMLRLNTSLVVLTLSSMIVLQSGSIIVSLTLPIAAVAIYGAGTRCYQLCKEVTNSLTAALLPVATSRHESGLAERNRDLYLVGTRYANAVLLAVTLPVGLLAEELLLGWLGKELSSGYVVAQILLLSLVVSNNHLIAIPILTAQGNVGRYAMLHLTWAAIAVGLGFFLTPILGVKGMAIAFGAPIVLLEPIYIHTALSRLNISWPTFIRSVVTPAYVPAIAVAVPAIAILHLARIHERGFLVAGCASATIAATYLFLFLFIGLSRIERKGLISHIPTRNRAGQNA